MSLTLFKANSARFSPCFFIAFSPSGLARPEITRGGNCLCRQRFQMDEIPCRTSRGRSRQGVRLPFLPRPHIPLTRKMIKRWMFLKRSQSMPSGCSAHKPQQDASLVLVLGLLDSARSKTCLEMPFRKAWVLPLLSRAEEWRCSRMTLSLHPKLRGWSGRLALFGLWVSARTHLDSYCNETLCWTPKEKILQCEDKIYGEDTQWIINYSQHEK